MHIFYLVYLAIFFYKFTCLYTIYKCLFVFSQVKPAENSLFFKINPGASRQEIFEGIASNEININNTKNKKANIKGNNTVQQKDIS
jgi:hypothetical protein